MSTRRVRERRGAGTLDVEVANIHTAMKAARLAE